VQVFDTVAVDFSSLPASPATLHLPLGEVNFFDRSLGAAKWMWDFGDGIRSDLVSPSHNYTAEGSYYVTLTAWSANGCRSQMVHGPFVVIAEDLMIPNVFSPNGDGINDIFLPMYTGSQPYSLEIYDRWGALHYSGNNKTLGWDGSTANGGAAPDGIYYYVVKVGDKAYEGPVTLVR
jgi:gliding motility-associated-like protein